MIVARKKFKHSIHPKEGREIQTKNHKPMKHPKKNKVNYIEKVQIIFGVIAIGALCIGIISGYVRLAESRYSINVLNKEVEQLQLQAENLTVELEGLKKSGWIEKKAKEELGMQYPSKEQMVFLDMLEHTNEIELSNSHKAASLDNKNNENIEENKIKDLFKRVYAFMN